MTDKTINDKLEALVHGRYTLYELNAVLSIMFDTTVLITERDIECGVVHEAPNLDDFIPFNINNGLRTLNIDVDLHYLKTNEDKYYITETSFSRN
jgi:hypothetical protein